MKIKIILLSALIALFSVTVASHKADRNPKAGVKKNVSGETRVSKGFPSEDRDQFN